jgi:uncharacterized RDD family membrane protein YckC
MEQQDLLLDLEQSLAPEKATTGARFVNYLMDAIFVGFFRYALNNFFTFTLLNSFVNFTYFGENRFLYSIAVFLYSLLWSALFKFVYYTVMEGATQGRTLGKFITGTRAVSIDGTAITWKDAFLRSLCRLIPFEIFSGFGTPWHDRLTKTLVVKVVK